MDRSQQDMRRAAARAFMESLDQLQDVLGPEESHKPSPTPPAPQKRPSPPKATSPQIDLDAWDQAVADIEAFMQEKSE